MAITRTQGSHSTGATLPFSPTAGRVLIAICTVRNWGVTFTTPTGWTKLTSVENNGNPSSNLGVFGKLAAGSDTLAGFGATSGGQSWEYMEIAGAQLTGYQATSQQGVALPLTPAGSSCIVLGCFTGGTFGTDYSGSGSWTLSSSGVSSDGDWPHSGITYQILTSASGAYTPAASGGPSGFTAAATIVLPAQPLGRSSIVMVG